MNILPATLETNLDRNETDWVGALPWRLDRKGNRRLLLVSSPDQGWTVPAGDAATMTDPARSAARHVFDQAGAIGETDHEPIGDYLHLSPGRRASLRTHKRYSSTLRAPRNDPESTYAFRSDSLAEDHALLHQNATLYAFRIRGTLVRWSQSGSRQRRWIAAEDVAGWISEPSLAGLIAEWLVAAKAQEPAQKPDRQDITA